MAEILSMTDSSLANERFARGHHCHRQGRLKEAEALYRQALAAAPTHVHATHYLGMVAFQSGRPFEALELLSLAVAADDRTPEIHANRAMVLRHINRRAEALAAYDRVLALFPNYSPAFIDRGALLMELGKPLDALASYEAALRLHADDADALNGRASALLALDCAAEALAACERAVALEPNNASVWYNRGRALHSIGDRERAVHSFDKAIAIESGLAAVAAHISRAEALLELKRPADALRSLERAIELQPDSAGAYSDRGAALLDLRRPQEALASCDTAIALAPGFAAAHVNRAAALNELGRPEEALKSCRTAIALQPDFVGAYVNGGVALNDLQRPDEAVEMCDRAIALDAGVALAHLNRGQALHELALPDEALASYERAMELAPDLAAPYFNSSLCYLQTGRFEQGWRLYEWRKRLPAAGPAFAGPQPRWTGKEDIEGKTLFLYSEQGLGDTIQFCRYAKLVEARGARVIMLVQPALLQLLSGLSSTIRVIAERRSLPDIDYHCALMSLPQAFATTFEDIPGENPYLFADQDRVLQWRERIGSAGFTIGICWQGRKHHADIGRSFPLTMFTRISKIEGVRLVSLQKGPGTEQLDSIAQHMAVERLGEAYDMGSFMDTAAVMQNLDLVITSDTSIAHLAGALGRRTFVVLKHVADWRWFVDREASPWYPRHRLFRQSGRGDWQSAFDAVYEEIVRQVKRA
jgi:tetratricopeptide (TPR) repeat protein